MKKFLEGGIEEKMTNAYCDCYSCSKCIHYGNCVDYDFDCDDLHWAYTYASEDNKTTERVKGINDDF